MSSERFDTIDMMTSTVAHSIFHTTIDREMKALITGKMAQMILMIPSEEMPLPTVFTACDALADFKREFRILIAPLVEGHSLFQMALKGVQAFNVPQREFSDVVTSKLFELLLAERTRKVFAVQRQRAEARGDDRVGVAFGMIKEDKADGE